MKLGPAHRQAALGSALVALIGSGLCCGRGGLPSGSSTGKTTGTLTPPVIRTAGGSAMVSIPPGTFLMGDRSGRPNEAPTHEVKVNAFSMDIYEVTQADFARYDLPNPSHFKGPQFPVEQVTWPQAALYCNARSRAEGLEPCYNEDTAECNFAANGYRLPTEAEWEYAARGGQYNPYYIYPWGNDADQTKANWPDSGDPYETGPLPWTTPVGFYNGQLQLKSDFNWPGSQTSYQTSNGANGYGLYDMAGDVWQYCNDWYQQNYYSVSPSVNPTGPNIAQASPMPDGKVYHVLRGGNWYNGKPDPTNPTVDNGHSRVSNRDPAYYLGQDEYQYCEVGFRIVRNSPSK